MKLKMIDSRKLRKGNYPIKGSAKAISAGKKAAETRARNRALNGTITVAKVSKMPKIKQEKVKFKQLSESNYHKIEINSPTIIYVHKVLNTIYISPSNTKIE